MKQFRSDNRKGGASAAKRLALALILIVACALMTACYMEPDRVVDAGNALDNSGKQDFQTVITDTPAPTNTPTPAPTSSSGQQMDWSAWTFGDDNATNPPASSTDASGVTALKPVDAIHDTLSPIYETLRILSRELPRETTLIGFAGAPWTVATYMVAGRGTKDQGPAHAMKAADRVAFSALIDRITDATIEYLSAQIEAGAEVVKLFDSWAGSLKGRDFDDFALAPAARIIAALKARHPGVPVIAFPREAGPRYEGFAKATGADAVAIDNSVDAAWAAAHVQKDGCVQGNLDPRHMVTGGAELVTETRRIVEAFRGGPHIFNLGHGITPDADPDNVALMIETVRKG